MSSMGVHAGMQPFASLVDGLVDDLLLHTGPSCNQVSLQFVQIVYWLLSLPSRCPGLVDPFLHNTPDLVINRI